MERDTLIEEYLGRGECFGLISANSDFDVRIFLVILAEHIAHCAPGEDYQGVFQKKYRRCAPGARASHNSPGTSHVQSKTSDSRYRRTRGLGFASFTGGIVYDNKLA